MQTLKNNIALIAAGLRVFVEYINNITNHLVVISAPLMMYRLSNLKQRSLRYLSFAVALVIAFSAGYAGLGLTFFGLSRWANAFTNHLLTYTGVYYTLGMVYDKYCDEQAWSTIQQQQQLPIIALGVVGMLGAAWFFPIVVGPSSMLLLSLTMFVGLSIHFPQELIWTLSISTLAVEFIRVVFGLIASRHQLASIFANTSLFPAYFIDKWIIAVACFAFSASRLLDLSVLLSKDLSRAGIWKKANQIGAFAVSLAAAWIAALPILQPAIRAIAISLMAIVFSQACSLIAFYPINLVLSKLAPKMHAKLADALQSKDYIQDQAKVIMDNILGLYSALISVFSLVYYQAVSHTNSLAYTLSTILSVLGSNYIWQTKAPSSWKKTALNWLVPTFMRVKDQTLFKEKSSNFMVAYLEGPMYMSALLLVCMNVWVFNCTTQAFTLGYAGSSISDFHKVATYSLLTATSVFLYMAAVFTGHVLADKSIKNWVERNKVAWITQRMPRWQYCLKLSHIIVGLPALIVFFITKQAQFSMLKLIGCSCLGLAATPIFFGISIVLESLIKSRFPSYYNTINKNNTLAALSVGLLGLIVSIFIPHSPTRWLMSAIAQLTSGLFRSATSLILWPFISAKSSLPSHALQAKAPRATWVKPCRISQYIPRNHR